MLTSSSAWAPRCWSGLFISQSDARLYGAKRFSLDLVALHLALSFVVPITLLGCLAIYTPLTILGSTVMSVGTGSFTAFEVEAEPSTMDWLEGKFLFLYRTRHETVKRGRTKPPFEKNDRIGALLILPCSLRDVVFVSAAQHVLFNDLTLTITGKVVSQIEKRCSYKSHYFFCFEGP